MTPGKSRSPLRHRDTVMVAVTVTPDAAQAGPGLCVTVTDAQGRLGGGRDSLSELGDLPA